jgi:DNA-binding MarR family transcriptional regulator
MKRRADNRLGAKPEAAPQESAAKLPDPGYFVSDFIPYLLNQTANLYNQGFKREVRQHGISVSHWRVLAVLDAAPDVSLTELAAHTAIDQPTLSRVIDQLVERGLVVSAPRAGDGRFLAIALTEAGKALYREIWPVAWKHHLRGMRDLTEAEQLMLSLLLKKVLKSLKSF